jgi:hypothetical protein
MSALGVKIVPLLDASAANAVCRDVGVTALIEWLLSK